MSNPIPRFKMTEYRLFKLKEYFLERYRQQNPFTNEKTARRNVHKQIREAKLSGNINGMYHCIAKNGFIEDSELFPTKYVPLDLEDIQEEKPESKPVPEPPVIPPKKKENKVGRVIHFDPKTLQKLIEKAESLDCSYSHLVRQAVKRYLAVI